MAGSADYDPDRRADLLAVRNVAIRNGAEPDDLWREGRLEITSGKTLAVIRTFAADSLGFPR